MKRRRTEARAAAATAARGFTLIEVLAALVIVALGMLGVIEAVTQEARNGTYLREKTLAHWIAMNVVTEQRLQPAPPPVAESSDDVDFAGRRWHWTMRVSQTQVQSLRRIDVSVRPADAADGTELAAVSGFYGAAIGPAGGGAIAWNDAGNGAPPGNGDQGNGEESGGTQGSKKRPVKPPVQGMPPIDPTANDE
jgi:general secretion pathway protein I